MRLDGLIRADVERAAQRLVDGELLAFATETVYGLGARADDDVAVARIFEAKGRPPGHPLIVHVLDAADVEHFAQPPGAAAQRLIQAFWPGPLTLILPRRPGAAAAACAGQPGVGLRSPAHPVARALLAQLRERGVRGVAAPSANRFGRVSPTRAEHVSAEFGDALWVLDGGECEVGIESSIVDCSRAHPVWLRPGVLTRPHLQSVAGEPILDADAQAPRAPGTLAAHYAPNAKVRVMPLPMLNTALQLLGEPPVALAVYSRGEALGACAAVRRRRMPGEAQQAAHELFSVLRSLDAEGAQLIWVEEPPADPEWDGVRDRLQRAAAS